MRRKALLTATAIATVSFGSPALAQNAGERSNTTTYVGTYNLSEGYEDRTVIGNFTNIYTGAIGIHTDVAYVDREENGTFLSGGLSYALNDTTRAKVMVGTSTNDVNILPSLFVRGEVQLKPAKGLIVTPAGTYREYRNGGSEIAPSVAVAKYFNVSGDTGGYYVAQGNAGLSFVKDTDDTGYTTGLGLTAVRNSGLSVGVNGTYGRMAYDTITGTGRLPVRSDVWGIGGKVAYKVVKDAELFVRGDYVDTDYYKVKGLSGGFALTF